MYKLRHNYYHAGPYNSKRQSPTAIVLKSSHPPNPFRFTSAIPQLHHYLTTPPYSNPYNLSMPFSNLSYPSSLMHDPLTSALSFPQTSRSAPQTLSPLHLTPRSPSSANSLHMNIPHYPAPNDYNKSSMNSQCPHPVIYPLEVVSTSSNTARPPRSANAHSRLSFTPDSTGQSHHERNEDDNGAFVAHQLPWTHDLETSFL